MMALFVGQMSEQLTICLIAVAANLIGMMVIYAAMSHAVVRSRTMAVVVLTVISQLFWIVPALAIVEAQKVTEAGSYALWLGNCLVCGFTLVILAKSAGGIPVSLAETARLDGLGGWSAWQETVLPFIRRDLLIVAAFTVMATLIPFWGCLTLPEAGTPVVLFQRLLSPSGHVAFMAAMSIVGTLPLLAIFFAAKRNR
jgi:ABC-type glycerol-3-phosphate transport system permease component